VFKSAGLPPDAVNVFLVNDNSLNAFVAGGMNLFIHTGLLQKSQNPEQVIGVIAHETGHIAGGHLSRIKEKMNGFSPESILGYVLGGAAILAGQAGAGSAMILGGQDASMRSLLQYSRTEEASADQAAVKYMDDTHTSSKGLLQFFEILKSQENTLTSQQNPYTRSHPLSADRVAFLRQHVQESKLSQEKSSPLFIEMHARMKAKLDGYILPPLHTLRLYPVGDNSIAARYARSMAYNKDSQFQKAIEEIDSLLAERPTDPYFNELKAQIYFDNGKLKEAIPFYEKSIAELPNEPLILIALGRTYLELDDPTYLEPAVKIIEKAVSIDKSSSFNWRQLGIAYGRMGKMAESSLALAEESYLQRNYKEAIYLAGRAENELKVGSPNWIQAQDLRITSERLLKKQQNR
jgi:predicted Zn-dependent protease